MLLLFPSKYSFEINGEYDIGLKVSDIYNNQETKTGDTTEGQYRVALPDGRMQVRARKAEHMTDHMAEHMAKHMAKHMAEHMAKHMAKHMAISFGAVTQKGHREHHKCNKDAGFDTFGCE